MISLKGQPVAIRLVFKQYLIVSYGHYQLYSGRQILSRNEGKVSLTQSSIWPIAEIREEHTEEQPVAAFLEMFFISMCLFISLFCCMFLRSDWVYLVS